MAEAGKSEVAVKVEALRVRDLTVEQKSGYANTLNEVLNTNQETVFKSKDTSNDYINEQMDATKGFRRYDGLAGEHASRISNEVRLKSDKLEYQGEGLVDNWRKYSVAINKGVASLLEDSIGSEQLSERTKISHDYINTWSQAVGEYFPDLGGFISGINHKISEALTNTLTSAGDPQVGNLRRELEVLYEYNHGKATSGRQFTEANYQKLTSQIERIQVLVKDITNARSKI